MPLTGFGRVKKLVSDCCFLFDGGPAIAPTSVASNRHGRVEQQCWGFSVVLVLLDVSCDAWRIAELLVGAH